MGNHEYCSSCGESDFHYGYPCDPKKLARQQKERAAQKERQEKLIIQAEILERELELEGHWVINDGTHLTVWPKIPGEKPLAKPTKCTNCGGKLPHKCATKGCNKNPGGNGWDCYKYCNECHEKEKR